jgi:hypothetical protein
MAAVRIVSPGINFCTNGAQSRLELIPAATAQANCQRLRYFSVATRAFHASVASLSADFIGPIVPHGSQITAQPSTSTSSNDDFGEPQNGQGRGCRGIRRRVWVGGIPFARIMHAKILNVNMSKAID